MSKRCFLFDLDGTLTDPFLGIASAVRFALRHFGIEAEDSELRRFIGPPLWDSFMQFYSFSREQAEEAVVKYREYYSEKGIFECTLYDGISELLGALVERGTTLAVATSKPLFFAKKVLRHFGIDTYFSFVSGSELDGGRSQKVELIQYALDNLGVDVKDAIMVGDRYFDIVGANAHGMDSIGVLYGYGNREELSKENPSFIVDDVKHLAEICQRLCLDTL